jgi:hypothetical protein
VLFASRGSATVASTFQWFDIVRTDLRVAVRQCRAPTPALGVIAAFALGVGANATMFSVIDRLLLRPPAQVSSQATCTPCTQSRATNFVPSFVDPATSSPARQA